MSSLMADRTNLGPELPFTYTAKLEHDNTAGEAMALSLSASLNDVDSICCSLPDERIDVQPVPKTMVVC